MTVLFIADLHLNKKKPKITASFLNFLHKKATKAKSLYILGDFFDYWIDDDDPNLPQKMIAQELKNLKNKGIPSYFIHGNRDCLLGKKFAKESGITLLPRETVITLYGHNILILHGDTLCTFDTTYQRYQKYVYNHFLQQLFLLLPLWSRQYVAEKIRKNHQSSTKTKPRYITDVNEQTVIEKFQKYQVDWIIHGHTHHPTIQKFNLNGKILYRAALGSWNQNGSVVKITPKRIELIEANFFNF